VKVFAQPAPEAFHTPLRSGTQRLTAHAVEME
jgi:hypothetical protein